MEDTRRLNPSLVLAVLLLYLGSLLLLNGTAVMASNITNAQYYGVITVANNGTNATLVSSNITGISTTSLINGGFANAGANNTVIRNSDGADVAFMPGYGTNVWGTWVPAISASSYLSYLFYTGGVTDGKIRYFPGAAGMSVADSAGIEPGSVWKFELKGFFDTVAGVGSYYWKRSGSSSGLFVNALNHIYFNLSGGAVGATLASGEHTLILESTVGSTTLTVDGVLLDTGAQTVITDTAIPWYYVESAAMPYMEYLKIWVSGTLRQHYTWQNAAVFTDQSGNGNDATPTFLTASSDADVTACLAWFQPVSEAKASAYSLSTAPDFITDPPTITGGFSTTVVPTYPGADVITAISAASGTPAQLPFTVLGGFITLTISLVAGWVMRRFGTNSLVFKAAVLIGCMGIAIGIGVFDWWMLFFFILPAIALWQLATSQQGRA